MGVICCNNVMNEKAVGEINCINPAKGIHFPLYIIIFTRTRCLHSKEKTSSQQNMRKERGRRNSKNRD
jgi:hypothetical protein